MLQITFQSDEMFDQETQEFIEPIEPHYAELEYSLKALSQWESKWEKSALSEKEMSTEQLIYLVQSMSLNGPIPKEVVQYMSESTAQELLEYIQGTHTATVITDTKRKKQTNSSKQITTEEIYSWMVELNIPFEVENWHINRLLTLMDIIQARSDTEKMPEKEVLKSNRELNEARKLANNTKG